MFPFPYLLCFESIVYLRRQETKKGIGTYNNLHFLCIQEWDVFYHAWNIKKILLQENKTKVMRKLIKTTTIWNYCHTGNHSRIELERISYFLVIRHKRTKCISNRISYLETRELIPQRIINIFQLVFFFPMLNFPFHVFSLYSSSCRVL